MNFRRLTNPFVPPVDDLASPVDSGPSNLQIAISRKTEQSPQYDFLWRVELPDLGTLMDPRLEETNSFLSQVDTGGVEGLSDISDINHRVFEFNAPYTTFDTRKSIDRGSFRYAVSHSDIGTITMTIDEMEDGLTLEYLLQWQKLIKNPDGSKNPPRFYKKPIKFIRMSATKLDLQYSTYINYFPTEIQPTANSYESNGVTQYQVVFTGDDVKHTPINRAQIARAINRTEQEVLLQDFRSSGFNFGGFDSQKQFAIFDRISRLF